MAQRCGGLSAVQKATEETQKLIDSVRSEAEAQAGSKFDKYEAISFRPQVVAGTNYFVKVDIGDGKYVHLRVFQPLPNTGQGPELSGIELNKSLYDEIDYFNN
ncbi:cystatin-B-like [Dendronephthya gigantea]|uniref:cystatin-B-like n=1 Tax=Dendronephthya gigantea TaxID=151771 RepID=UPI00106B08FF|nr:cystatin-B-like [Dendronephthya gigantea]XP_028414746.1 cystatin-B-like [Dendronephthya gigantea]